MAQNPSKERQIPPFAGVRPLAAHWANLSNPVFQISIEAPQIGFFAQQSTGHNQKPSPNHSFSSDPSLNDLSGSFGSTRSAASPPGRQRRAKLRQLHSFHYDPTSPQRQHTLEDDKLIDNQLSPDNVNRRYTADSGSPTTHIRHPGGAVYRTSLYGDSPSPPLKCANGTPVDDECSDAGMYSSTSDMVNYRHVAAAQEMARDVNLSLSLRAQQGSFDLGDFSGAFHSPVSAASGIGISPASWSSYSPITPGDWRMSHPTHVDTLKDLTDNGVGKIRNLPTPSLILDTQGKQGVPKEKGKGTISKRGISCEGGSSVSISSLNVKSDGTSSIGTPQLPVQPIKQQERDRRSLNVIPDSRWQLVGVGGGFKKPAQVSSRSMAKRVRPLPHIQAFTQRLMSEGDRQRLLVVLSQIATKYLSTQDLVAFTLCSKKIYKLAKRQRWLKTSLLNACLTAEQRPWFWLDLCAKLRLLEESVALDIMHRSKDAAGAPLPLPVSPGTSNPATKIPLFGIPYVYDPSRQIKSITKGDFCHHASSCGGAPHRDSGLGIELFYFLRAGNLEPAKCDEISRDVSRTFPTHELFKNTTAMGRSGQGWMYQVLHALACANPSIGYCQGMNYLVAGLLIHLRCPIAAFWMSLAVMRHFDYGLMFSPGVVLVPARVYQFSETVRRFLPKLWNHLHRHTLTVDFFAHKWFPTLFAYYLDPHLLARVWDGFFALGWKWFFRVGLAVLSHLQERLMTNDVEGMNRVIQASKFSIGERDEEVSRFMHLANSFKVTNSYLSKLSKDFHIAKFIGVVDSIPDVSEALFSTAGRKKAQPDNGSGGPGTSKHRWSGHHGWNAGSGMGGGGEPLRGVVSQDERWVVVDMQGVCTRSAPLEGVDYFWQFSQLRSRHVEPPSSYGPANMHSAHSRSLMKDAKLERVAVSPMPLPPPITPSPAPTASSLITANSGPVEHNATSPFAWLRGFQPTWGSPKEDPTPATTPDASQKTATSSPLQSHSSPRHNESAAGAPRATSPRTPPHEQELDAEFSENDGTQGDSTPCGGKLWWLDLLFPDVIIPPRRFGLFGDDELCERAAPAYLGNVGGADGDPPLEECRTSQLISVMNVTHTPPKEAGGGSPKQTHTDFSGNDSTRARVTEVTTMFECQWNIPLNVNSEGHKKRMTELWASWADSETINEWLRTAGTVFGGTSHGRYLVLALEDVVQARHSITVIERQTKADLRQFQTKIESTEKALVHMFKDVEGHSQRQKVALERKELIMKEKHEMLQSVKQLVSLSPPHSPARPETVSSVTELMRNESNDSVEAASFDSFLIHQPPALYGHSAPASRAQSDNESSDSDGSWARQFEPSRAGGSGSHTRAPRTIRRSLLGGGKKYRRSSSPAVTELPMIPTSEWESKRSPTAKHSSELETTTTSSEQHNGAGSEHRAALHRDDRFTLPSMVAKRLDRYGISGYRRKKSHNYPTPREMGSTWVPSSEPPGPAGPAPTTSEREEKQLAVTMEQEMQRAAQLERRYDKANVEWQELEKKQLSAQEALADITEEKRCLLETQHKLVTSQEQDKRDVVWNLVMSGVWVWRIPPSVLPNAPHESPEDEKGHQVLAPLAPQLVSALRTFAGLV
eukprot:GHVN01000728.1.p1 GENE.GHVN01000728.1~~GHVN01000728.1.p1  ORF type:complete len:1610 (+),score=226.98 GHVN01000728.1:754-5583(+)